MITTVEATGDEKEPLACALSIAFHGHKGATHFRCIDNDGVPTLVLYWFDDKKGDAKPFPFMVKYANSLDIVSGWLEEANYGERPSTDGSVKKGWKVFSGGGFYSICCVQPFWVIYGK